MKKKRKKKKTVNSKRGLPRGNLPLLYCPGPSHLPLLSGRESPGGSSDRTPCRAHPTFSAFLSPPEGEGWVPWGHVEPGGVIVICTQRTVFTLEATAAGRLGTCPQPPSYTEERLVCVLLSLKLSRTLGANSFLELYQSESCTQHCDVGGCRVTARQGCVLPSK